MSLSTSLPCYRGSARRANLPCDGLPGTQPVCTENLYPRIAVMESAEDGERFDASSSLDRASNRRIFVQ
jgi:hypothetical protein